MLVPAQPAEPPPPELLRNRGFAQQPQPSAAPPAHLHPMITPVSQELYTPPAEDAITAWCGDVMPQLEGKQRHNFCQLLRLSGIEPALDVASVEHVILAKGPYLRLTWSEGRGWQRASLFDHSKDASVLRGGHGTTAVGTAHILRTKFVSRMGFAGVYGLMTPEYGDEWLNFTINKVAEGGKNWSGVVIELRARCRRDKSGYGGTDADAYLVNQYIAAHQSKSNGGRWCLPEPFVEFVGIWVPLFGELCDELPGCRVR